METIIPWSSEKFPAAGRCIYGGDHEGPFTDEHIIPFGLLPKGGDWYLPEASCQACACITTKFEDLCLRNTLGLFREQLGLKTRQKKNRGKPIVMIVKRPDGSLDRITDIANNLPKYCLSFIWRPPGLLRTGALRSEVNFDRAQIIARYAKGELKRFIPEGHGVRLGGIRMLDYARMLAKIAHSYAYAKCGLDTFEPMLPDLILGKDEHAPYLIGGDPRGIPPAQARVLHDIYPMSVTIGEGGPRYLGIVIRLFAFWGSPSYLVVVGKQVKEIPLPKQQQSPYGKEINSRARSGSSDPSIGAFSVESGSPSENATMQKCWSRRSR